MSVPLRPALYFRRPPDFQNKVHTPYMALRVIYIRFIRKLIEPL